MHKNTTKCNETLSKWCKNKHGASKIIDTFETYQSPKFAFLSWLKHVLYKIVEKLENDYLCFLGSYDSTCIRYHGRVFLNFYLIGRSARNGMDSTRMHSFNKK
jgi:hypothetical protein